MIESKYILIKTANDVAEQLVAMNQDLIQEGEMPTSLKDIDYIMEYCAGCLEFISTEAKQIAECIAFHAPAPLSWVDLKFEL